MPRLGVFCNYYLDNFTSRLGLRKNVANYFKDQKPSIRLAIVMIRGANKIYKRTRQETP